ncbi:hypothetical protein ATI61_106362 [Archangium gephyra]|uniref:Lipoprotein n=1 Tax=Archangium gephyra TaxID=48 RepID=A0AAC8Q153_9BACT|nr:hypothetical protein [Archangium gephyra]AKI98983.1 putative lipoprotein [Archangium gephyra]REG30892.1 hypothetical protein ATI61_106362 [Archangium gephyra]
MRHLLPVLALLLLAACPRAPEELTPPPVDPPVPEQPSGLQGSLTVHLRDWNLVPKEFLQSAYVLLGDGSRFRQAVDDNGDVHFQDAAIVGSQDVTVVLTMKSETPTVLVGSFLAIGQPEVWLPVVDSLETTEPPPDPGPKLATVSGKVTGMSGAAEHFVYVIAAGQGLSGGGPVASDGSFRFNVLGAEPGQVDLIAWEEKFDPEYGTYGDVLVRAGRVRGIALARDQVLGGLELALDHAADQSLGVTVKGAEHYGSPATVTLRFHEDTLGFFTSYAKGTSPLSVPTLAMTPPFDTTRRLLSTSLGRSEVLPAGYAYALNPIDNGPAATLTLLSPMTSSSPALGACASPPTTPLAGLGLRWSVDAAANVGQLDFLLQEPAGPGAGFSWRVLAPSSRTSFTPFPLPSEVSPLSTFPPGLYSLKLQSSFRGDVEGYASAFAQHVSKPSYLVESRRTELTGCFTLQ